MRGLKRQLLHALLHLITQWPAAGLASLQAIAGQCTCFTHTPSCSVPKLCLLPCNAGTSGQGDAAHPNAPAAAASGTTAAAGAAAAATPAATGARQGAATTAAAGSKRPLTDSQLENHKTKPCQECGRPIPPACKKCTHPDCKAQQQLKSEQQRKELLQPMQPYVGRGALPQAQDSKQALANVEKRLLSTALLKQVSHMTSLW